MNDYHLTNVNCPRCNAIMEWAATTDELPYIVDYHCDGTDENPGGCGWKGDYNHLTNQFDEYSDEDYVISDNYPLDEALNRARVLGCDVVDQDETQHLC